MSAITPLPPQSFQEEVKEFFRLHKKRTEMAAEMKQVNAEYNAMKKTIIDSMTEKNIPGVEYGSYRLKCSTSKRKQPINEKLLRGCSFFANNEQSREEFLLSLSGDRQVVERPLLQVRNKV